MGRFMTLLAAVSVLVGCQGPQGRGPRAQDAGRTARAWRALPLVGGGKVDPAWFHTGYGSFAVDPQVDGALRTDADERGMGLLVYGKEKFGDCQIRVVYRRKDPKSNAGVYVRIDDGILGKAGEKPQPAKRTADGGLTEPSLEAMKADSEKEVGPWYAVHHGYEVQIADAGDELHRTGAIYSLAKAEAAPPPADANAWRTLLITLDGERITVDLDGRRVSTFDAAARDVPPRKEWHEPKREPKRPTRGYLGLQNHDPGDVVWFKEVSVRPR